MWLPGRARSKAGAVPEAERKRGKPDEEGERGRRCATSKLQIMPLQV